MYVLESCAFAPKIEYPPAILYSPQVYIVLAVAPLVMAHPEFVKSVEVKLVLSNILFDVFSMSLFKNYE